MSLKPLLRTHTIDCNQAAVRTILEEKCVLLAGTSGAFGLELCRHILRCSPQKLIIVERYEPYLTERVAGLLHPPCPHGQPPQQKQGRTVIKYNRTEQSRVQTQQSGRVPGRCG